MITMVLTTSQSLPAAHQVQPVKATCILQRSRSKQVYLLPSSVWKQASAIAPGAITDVYRVCPWKKGDRVPSVLVGEIM